MRKAADVITAFTSESIPPSDVQRLTELQAETCVMPPPPYSSILIDVSEPAGTSICVLQIKS